MADSELSIEFVPEEIVDGGKRAWVWLLRGDENKLELLANKQNKFNSEPLKYLFNCANCPALLLLKSTIASQPIEKLIAKSEFEWARVTKEMADKERGIEYPAERFLEVTYGRRGKGAVYDRETEILRVTAFCAAMRRIFDGQINETTNCS